MRKLIVLLLFISCTISTQAQLSIGFKAGYSYSFPIASETGMGDEPIPEYKNAHGINSSFTLYHRLRNNFHIGIEPGIVQRGSACTNCKYQGNPVFKNKMTLNYLDLPFMIKLDFPFDKARMSLDFKVGYSLAYLYSVTIQIHSQAKDLPEPETILRGVEMKPAHHKRDHGVHSGIGVSRMIGTGSLFLDAIVYHGYKYVTKNQGNIKFRSVNLALGYRFELKGKG